MRRIISIKDISEKAFKELKDICIEEYGDTMTDDEIRDMGVRLLNLFSLVYGKEERQEIPLSPLTSVESKAFDYIKLQIMENNYSPSTRDVARALGHTSSRTGLNMINRLIQLGRIERVGKTQLRIKR